MDGNNSCERLSTNTFSKCRKQCFSACDDKRCCSPQYYSGPSTCTIPHSLPCTCLQNIALDYNIVESWPGNWSEEFVKLRRMWSHHSKFSSYNLSDESSPTKPIVSKYCNRNFCWHERPYRTNSMRVQCTCCAVRNYDSLSENVSHEDIPRLYGLDCLKDSEKRIIPCYSNIYTKEYPRNYPGNIDAQLVCCPCCKSVNVKPELRKFDVEDLPARESVKHIQRCYKNVGNDRPKTAKYQQKEDYPIKEEGRQIQRCYRKSRPTSAAKYQQKDDYPVKEEGRQIQRCYRKSRRTSDIDYEDGCSTREIYLRQQQSDEDSENAEAVVHFNRNKKKIPPNVRDTSRHSRDNKQPRKRLETSNLSRSPLAVEKQLPPRMTHDVQGHHYDRAQEQHIPEKLVKAFKNVPMSTNMRELSTEHESRRPGENDKKLTRITIGGSKDNPRRNNTSTNRKPSYDKSRETITIYDHTHPNYIKPATSVFNQAFVQYYPERDRSSKGYKQRIPRRNLKNEFHKSTNGVE